MRRPRSHTPCRSILITFNGDTTHATHLTGYTGDVRTRSARAKCHEDDAYNAYEGARIALARLYGVDPFPTPAPTIKEIKDFKIEVKVTPVYEEAHK